MLYSFVGSPLHVISNWEEEQENIGKCCKLWGIRRGGGEFIIFGRHSPAHSNKATVEKQSHGNEIWNFIFLTNNLRRYVFESSLLGREIALGEGYKQEYLQRNLKLL